MEMKMIGKETSLLLLFLIITPHLILIEKAAGLESSSSSSSSSKEEKEEVVVVKDDDGGSRIENKQMPSLVERAIGITGGRWDSFKTWAKLAWINSKPPDAHAGFEESRSGAEKVKEAATKSFETAEETAVSSAKAAGDAVEKIKRTVSDDAEL